MDKLLMGMSLGILLTGTAFACSADTVAIRVNRTDNPVITVYHDEERAVTCWLWWNSYGSDLECLPDASLAP